MGVEDFQKVEPKFKSAFNQKEPNPLWLKLCEVLNYNPSKFQKFKDLVD
jgi:hypothetical protein